MKIRNLLFVGALALFIAGCSEAGTDQPARHEWSVAFLNNGNWNSNDACICLSDLKDGATDPAVFENVNGKKLGDLAQDMAVYGDDYLVSMNGSQLVYVLGRDFKVKKEIIAEHDGMRLSPRCLCVVDDRIYVTYYEGFLGELDPLDGYGLRLASVGPNPDGLAYAGGKIYVANSGGYLSPEYGNTVSVVDMASFKEVATVTVNSNPVALASDEEGTAVYVCSWGNYADKPSALERIDVATLEVSAVPYANVRGIAAGRDDILYVVTGEYDQDWQISGAVNSFDMRTGRKAGELTDVRIPSYYSISADPSGLVFVGSSDYTTEGDVFVFDEKGVNLAKISSGGLNPLKGVCL